MPTACVADWGRACLPAVCAVLKWPLMEPVPLQWHQPVPDMLDMLLPHVQKRDMLKSCIWGCSAIIPLLQMKLLWELSVPQSSSQSAPQGHAPC